jgi:ribose 5-phosphate isomerase B
MKIYIGADHNGYGPKKLLSEYLIKAGHEVEDIGDKTFDPDDDFPVFASTAANKVLSSDNKDARGVLICGSGQGMVMAANRHKGIRAGLGWSVSAAKSIRNDEDSNIIALPSELFRGSGKEAFAVVDAWLNTPFAGAARYLRRNRELDEL